MKLEAVCFDIDGTLYPNSSMYFRSIPLFLRHIRLFSALNKARKILRHEEPGKNFHARQAELTAGFLGIEPEDARLRIQKVIYGEWARSLKGMRLFSGVEESMEKFRRAGLKVGVLSDFPVEGKFGILGISFAPDAILSTEDWGALKPRPDAFRALAMHLGCQPEHILYVGNSHAYDVTGAKQAGMHAALLGSGKGRLPEADLNFRSYEVLCNFVLKNL